MGVVLLLFNISRPRRLIELSKVSQTASRTLAENSRYNVPVNVQCGSDIRGEFEDAWIVSLSVCYPDVVQKLAATSERNMNDRICHPNPATRLPFTATMRRTSIDG
jgi:hypothetical protein